MFSELPEIALAKWVAKSNQPVPKTGEEIRKMRRD